MTREMIGELGELKSKGCLAGKVGTQPVCVFWTDGRAYALDDRCPHMGFPLHRGSVENGLVTCHWHHARFDVASGGTLDPFADDVRAHDVEIEGNRVFVALRADSDPVAHHLHRLSEGLEQGLTLVTAKAVLALIDLLGPQEGTRATIRAGIDFGIHNREAGWGAGLTVLTAMANVAPALSQSDRALAMVHGLMFVSRDTRGRPPRFPLSPLKAEIDPDRLGSWYRRFVDTRNGDAAERVIATATTADLGGRVLAEILGAAVTDHVFVDGGHTIDFTNKAFESLDHLGAEQARSVLPTLAQQMAGASRSEESGQWRHPDDLAGLLASLDLALDSDDQTGGLFDDREVEALAWDVLGDDPAVIVDRLHAATRRGATPEQLSRAVAYAASLRLVRFHTQNDHGDWDSVHHAFTTASATHQMVMRAPTPELVRGIYQGALKVYLDRFLNVPAARLPGQRAGSDELVELSQLQECWDREGMVDEAGVIAYRWLQQGGDPGALVQSLGSALLAEDADFHWYQTYEAGLRQAASWPADSEPAALILSGVARFLAAHTPTRRELSQVVRIAARLRRGEALYDEM